VLQQTVALADPRVPFTINVEGRQLRTSFAAKAVRKCLATLHQSGPENVAVIIQGQGWSRSCGRRSRRNLERSRRRE
jgi:hypothetical protein